MLLLYNYSMNKIKKYFVDCAKETSWKWYAIGAGVVLLVVLALAIFKPFEKKFAVSIQTGDKYRDFLTESYTMIKDNYWKQITDDELFNLYKLGWEKIDNKKVSVVLSSGPASLSALLGDDFKNMTDDKKKENIVNLATIVLANLQPFGRSGLFTPQKEEDLKNRVNNIDPNTNLYSVLGVAKNADPMEIKKTADAEAQKLAVASTDKKATDVERQQATDKLAQVKRAAETLTQPAVKQNYDKFGTEATVYVEPVSTDIYYIKMKQFSPQTYQDFQTVVNNIKGEPSALILDLRGNVGGSVDILPAFLGFFIGTDRYAFDWWHRGESTPFKSTSTFLPSLVSFKQVAILIDGATQSTAEIMVATLKKYNVGVTVGATTKGWGTIEKVFEIKHQLDDQTKYSMFLVHSLTLADDNQPIEGNGVKPMVEIKNSNWSEQLLKYFHYQEFINAIKEKLKK